MRITEFVNHIATNSGYEEYIRSHIVGSRLLDEIDKNETIRADMNDDNSVDIVDVVIMRRIIIHGE